MSGEFARRQPSLNCPYMDAAQLCDLASRQKFVVVGVVRRHRFLTLAVQLGKRCASAQGSAYDEQRSSEHVGFDSFAAAYDQSSRASRHRTVCEISWNTSNTLIMRWTDRTRHAHAAGA
jgi:hypothetical protein